MGQRRFAAPSWACQTTRGGSGGSHRIRAGCCSKARAFSPTDRCFSIISCTIAPSLAVYLRLNDEPVPATYGPSADDRLGFRTAAPARCPDITPTSRVAPGRRLDAAPRHADEPQRRCQYRLGTNSRPHSSQRKGSWRSQQLHNENPVSRGSIARDAGWCRTGRALLLIGGHGPTTAVELQRASSSPS
jgi:hypothetical protein